MKQERIDEADRCDYIASQKSKADMKNVYLQWLYGIGENPDICQTYEDKKLKDKHRQKATDWVNAGYGFVLRQVMKHKIEYLQLAPQIRLRELLQICEYMDSKPTNDIPHSLPGFHDAKIAEFFRIMITNHGDFFDLIGQGQGLQDTHSPSLPPRFSRLLVTTIGSNAEVFGFSQIKMDMLCSSEVKSKIMTYYKLLVPDDDDDDAWQRVLEIFACRRTRTEMSEQLRDEKIGLELALSLKPGDHLLPPRALLPHDTNLWSISVRCKGDFRRVFDGDEFPLTAEKLLAQLLGLAKALLKMHEQGVAHMDIKLDNILVDYEDDNVENAVLLPPTPYLRATF